MNPTIVILDGHTTNPGDNPWDALAALGHLTVHERSAPGEVVSRARGAEVVMTNKTPLRADVLRQLEGLRLVVVLATGFDVVDIEEARKLGVVVCNIPAYATESVAEHVFALTLELCRGAGAHTESVRSGEWTRNPDWCYWKTPQIELFGLTMGLVGYGRIAQRVAEIARVFGMRVLAVEHPAFDTAAFSDVTWVDRPRLFEESDVISLHCPLTNDTLGLVDRALLSRMKTSAFLINTARGPLVDQEALAEALSEGRIAGAALDVVREEPIAADNPLLKAPRCILTPHLAWACLSSRQRLMKTAAENVKAFLDGDPINVVS